MNKSFGIRIIGYTLAILYGLSIAIYYLAATQVDFHRHAAVLMGLFSFLFIGSVGFANVQNWGRKWVMWGNFLLVLYLLGLYKVRPDAMFTNYVLVSVIVLFYVNMSNIRQLFLSQHPQGQGSLEKWKSVLIVDDDESLIKTVRPILMSAGYSVLTANSGEEGLLIAEKQKPDLIILDVILPGIKGREVCKQLKEQTRTKNIPVVFLTAKDSPDDVRAELEAGAQSHLTKPVNPKDLLSCVRKILV